MRLSTKRQVRRLDAIDREHYPLISRVPSDLYLHFSLASLPKFISIALCQVEGRHGILGRSGIRADREMICKGEMDTTTGFSLYYFYLQFTLRLHREIPDGLRIMVYVRLRFA